jgi:hypothetical protein
MLLNFKIILRFFSQIYLGSHPVFLPPAIQSHFSLTCETDLAVTGPFVLHIRAMSDTTIMVLQLLDLANEK